MATEKDETFTVLVKGKPLATVKADLIHAFLSVKWLFLIQIFNFFDIIISLMYEYDIYR